MDGHPSTVGKPTHAGLRGVLISLVFIVVLAPVGAVQVRPAVASSIPRVVTAPAAPTVTGFTPAAGPVGTTVTVTGTGFTGATKVAFHGTSAAFRVNNAARITATVPSGATTGTIAVTTPGGTATSTASFTVTAPAAPTITKFTPASGGIGSKVTLTGTHFTGATKVAFHGVSAVFSVSSATKITATVPSGATTGTIAVTTPGGTGTSATSFTVTAPPKTPSITSFAPAAGPVGTRVILTGAHFTGATKVAFHGVSALFSVSSASRITATVPSGATTGTIAVTTPGGTGTSATSFAVLLRAKVTLRLRGLTSGVMRLGRRVTAKGVVTPASLAGSSVTLTVQKKQGTRWVRVRRVARTISATGTYGWSYKPAKRGAYRMRATIARTAVHTSATTTWRAFRVR